MASTYSKKFNQHLMYTKDLWKTADKCSLSLLTKLTTIYILFIYCNVAIDTLTSNIYEFFH